MFSYMYGYLLFQILFLYHLSSTCELDQQVQENEMNGIRVNYERAGDIILPIAMNENSIKIWPKGQFIYQLDSELSYKDQRVIKREFNDISQRTCLRFVERTIEKDYVLIKSGTTGQPGCWSYVGLVGGEQRLNLDKSCLAPEIVMHQILHALGLQHEHSRPDRDQFIKINYKNIQPGLDDAFKKMSFNTFDLPYEYKSIMHFPSNAYAKDENIPTIIPLSGDMYDLHKTNEIMTQMDVEKLRALYKCNG